MRNLLVAALLLFAGVSQAQTEVYVLGEAFQAPGVAGQEAVMTPNEVTLANGTNTYRSCDIVNSGTQAASRCNVNFNYPATSTATTMDVGFLWETTDSNPANAACVQICASVMSNEGSVAPFSPMGCCQMEDTPTSFTGINVPHISGTCNLNLVKSSTGAACDSECQKAEVLVTFQWGTACGSEIAATETLKIRGFHGIIP